MVTNVKFVCEVSVGWVLMKIGSEGCWVILSLPDAILSLTEPNEVSHVLRH